MHRHGSRARVFFAVTLLLIALGSTSAMAEPVTCPIEFAKDLDGAVLLDSQENLAGVQSVGEAILITDAKAATHAGASPSSEKKSGFPETTFDLDLSWGYRVDNFDWNIASSASGTTTPNILSELTWDDLEIFQVKADAKIVMGRLLYFRGYLDAGAIFEGQCSMQKEKFSGPREVKGEPKQDLKKIVSS